MRAISVSALLLSSIVPHGMRLGSLGACSVDRAHLARCAGTLSAFVPFLHTFRPSFSLCIRQVWRIRKCRPARNVLNADVAFVPCVFMRSSSFVYVSASYAVFSIALAVKIFPFFLSKSFFSAIFLAFVRKKSSTFAAAKQPINISDSLAIH